MAALIAGMLPVAIGMGEGGEFYRPMAVAIIGGTITSTLLTLLVIPSFYDSIELKREHVGQKFQAHRTRWNALVSLALIALEALAMLTLLRAGYRGVKAVSRKLAKQH
jgi:hypothetical protein